MNIIFGIIGVIIAFITWNFWSVHRANRKLYKGLIKLGFDHKEAKYMVDRVNTEYQAFVRSTGGKGLLLSHYSEAALLLIEEELKAEDQ